MKQVWDRIEFRDLTGKDKELGDGMLQMFCDLGPFKTFGTITVAPKHDRCKVAAGSMEKIVLRTFRKRRFKGMKFGYFIEANKQRPGTHAHFVTKDEPSDLRWAGEGSVGEFMIERYGRFESQKVDGKKTFGLAAYLAKYCSKELADQHWGFHGWYEEPQERRPKLRAMWDKQEVIKLTSTDLQKWERIQQDWKWMKSAGSKIRQHSGSRENGRTNVRTYEVREDPKVPGHFEQEIVYNNLK
jgi:hypothetical protein